MDSIHICGGCPLNGEIRVQGSKNAVLPILAAAALVDGTVTLTNCPKIADVFWMMKLLQGIGCDAAWHDGQIMVNAENITESRLPKEYVTKMRSSIIMMGALLGRTGRASIDYPGGCVIGRRPIDIHLRALSSMGAALTEEGGRLTAYAERLSGGEIEFAFPSVGATENCILAAALADGETVVRGAAREPEIQALCEFLLCAGADINALEEGRELRIRGVERLHSCTFRIPPDRIVAGTYMMGCMAAGGSIRLTDAQAGQLGAVLEVIGRMGGMLSCRENEIALTAPKRPEAIPFLRTAVYPGYPTDLQSQLLAVLALADGESVVEEAIFENRFRAVPELCRMGADIQILGNRASIWGVGALHGTYVTALELRGGAALCMAALAAKFDTYIGNRHFIDRGYEALERDIRGLGGRI